MEEASMEEAKQLFKKLKIHTLLDLALLTPTSYNDTTLTPTPQLGKVNTLEAKVIESSIYAGKLRVTFLLTSSGRRVSSTFFRATPYHHKLFEVGSAHVIQGRLEEYKGFLQMSQPKSIKQVGKITPKYQTVLKESEITSLIACYVNEQNLFNAGLDSKEVATILSMHFPKNLQEVYAGGSFKLDFIPVLKFIEAYNHLKKLRGKRADFPARRALSGSIKPFVEHLPFTLTNEQQTVIAQIQKDLARTDKAAKRMVVGDVGSGKTMVILAAAMMALPHKSILMAPTSLLALQLYEEACKYLPNEVNIALVMQGNHQGDYRSADFIIGTHALLYKEDLPEVSLVMIDEQHRFGTKQRQSLEVLAGEADATQTTKKPHFIQFSATPIPRTQAMMESELLDVSLITTTPFDREVLTQTIGKQDFSSLLAHIKEEIAQEHQVLLVYPLVEESSEVPYQSLEESRGFWEEKFDGVYVTHGKDKQKEEVLLEFREKGNILLATTVVEVGISLPRLTLVVIVGAERLGLATLHQLRGRVGRNGLKSWCYLYSNTQNNFRLEQFCQTTNGFDIAKLDLKFRNSGDILDGTIQSGQKFKWLDMAEDEEIIMRAKNRLNAIKLGIRN
ncbi:MAG TPA: ATP-dependent DNA helicase RecG [Sulfurovum sp.]|jgi:ATP-dependent DNA helicase RecG|nr:ATP-dependent DNA helicase RecG [Sulfurovum sp.]HQS72120.1 ATP-dependent DNA helicase RecG [Sulfurovum sp.]HQS77728.1 ATP-dependent DNA helicase RecG [Sulfurovum sp.]HQT28415.1 ATP-dependent DNA helicase RecG [Sulfurovum sp.]